MKTEKDIEELCRKIKPIIGDEADKLWLMYLAEDSNGRKDIALDIEIIAEKLLKKNTLSSQEILLEPPSKNNSSGSFLLGDVYYNNVKQHSLYLKSEDFIKQIFITGITGEGKSNLASNLALQLLKSNVPFMVIDWKRSWRNLLSLKDKHPELKNVQVFTIGRKTLPFLWNPFRKPPGSDTDLWINTIADALERSHVSGQGVAYHLNTIYPKLFKEISGIYPNFYDGKRKIDEIKPSLRELQWKQSAQRIFHSFTMGSASKVFNARSPLKLEELLENSVILELDIEMPENLRTFFSEMILRWIHLYRLSTGDRDKLQHVLFLEEVHNLYKDNGFYKENHTLFNVFRQIRSSGQGIVSLTQHAFDVPLPLIGNSHTQIFFGQQHAKDIMAAKNALFLNFGEESFPNKLGVGECIVKIKNRVQPCLVKAPLVPVQKGVVDDEWLRIHNLGCMFWKNAWKGGESSANFKDLKNSVNRILLNKNGMSKNEGYKPLGNPKFALEWKKKTNATEYPSFTESNTPWYSKSQLTQNTSVSDFKKTSYPGKNRIKPSVNISKKKAKYPLNVEPNKLLEDIFLFPFSGVTQRYKRLNLSADYGNNLRYRLINQNCIVPRKIITGKGRIALFDLTGKGKIILRDLGFEFKDIKEGIVHRYWKFKIAEFYEKKGFKVLVEEPVNGRPDIIIINGDQKVAVEVETGRSDAIGNIKNRLNYGFDEVICIATHRNVEGKIRDALKREKIFDKKVRVTGVRSFGV